MALFAFFVSFQIVEQLRLQVKRSKGMSAELDNLNHKLSEQYKGILM